MAKTNEIFNAEDADVIIRSSDGVDFRLHKKNLECTTGGFPPAEFPSDLNDIVQLTESANTLEILFHAVYPLPFPSLRGLQFDTLLTLAEAAEKYEIFSMIQACRREL
ncbi:hypothetical protein GYMLUDRAFT_237911 [Collybiopsis luxurians FD-317 M1]|nr:hypothetical protein GYMLUDRAFT_237911 [Collybiopsis luxurians FD-317 M1]